MPTENDIFILCNSLNACQGGVRSEYPHLAQLLQEAQSTIMKLYEENQALKGDGNRDNER